MKTMKSALLASTLLCALAGQAAGQGIVRPLDPQVETGRITLDPKVKLPDGPVDVTPTDFGGLKLRVAVNRPKVLLWADGERLESDTLTRLDLFLNGAGLDVRAGTAPRDLADGLSGDVGVIVMQAMRSQPDRETREAMQRYVRAGGRIVFLAETVDAEGESVAFDNNDTLACFGLTARPLPADANLPLHPWLGSPWFIARVKVNSPFEPTGVFADAGQGEANEAATLRSNGVSVRSSVSLFGAPDIQGGIDDCSAGEDTGRAELFDVLVMGNGFVTGKGTRLGESRGDFIVLTDWTMSRIGQMGGPRGGDFALDGRLSVSTDTYLGGLMTDANCPFVLSLMGVDADAAARACTLPGPDVLYAEPGLDEGRVTPSINMAVNAPNGLISAWFAFDDGGDDRILFDGTAPGRVNLRQALESGPGTTLPRVNTSDQELAQGMQLCARDRLGLETCAPIEALETGGKPLSPAADLAERGLSVMTVDSQVAAGLMPAGLFGIEAASPEEIDNLTAFNPQGPHTEVQFLNSTEGRLECSRLSVPAILLPKVVASSVGGVGIIDLTQTPEALTTALESLRGPGEDIVLRIDRLDLEGSLFRGGNRAVTGNYSLHPGGGVHIGFFNAQSGDFRPVLSANTAVFRVSYNFFDPEECNGQFTSAKAATPLRFVPSGVAGPAAATLTTAMTEAFGPNGLELQWLEIGAIISEDVALSRTDVFDETVGARGDRRAVGQTIDPGLLEEFFILYPAGQ